MRRRMRKGEYMVVCKITPSEELYQVMAKIYMREAKGFKRRKTKLLFLCMVSLYLIVLSVFNIMLNPTEMTRYAFMAIGIFTLLYGVWFYFVGAKKQVLAAIKKAGRSTEHLERTVTFDEDIHIQTDRTDSRFSWDMIEQWGEIEQYLYLQYNNSILPLDTTKMATEDVNWLKEKLGSLNKNETQEKGSIR